MLRATRKDVGRTSPNSESLGLENLYAQYPEYAKALQEYFRDERYRYYTFGPRLLDAGNKPHPTVMFRQYQPDGRLVGTACRLALQTNQGGSIHATSEIERVRDAPIAKEGPKNE